jgi:alkylresorcinol/alkylpyrone synthase
LARINGNTGDPMTKQRLAHIASLATAVPRHHLERDFVAAEARRIFARFGDEFERMANVFTNTGINRRYSVCPVEWFESATGWNDRATRFLEGAKALFRQSANEALEKASLRAGDIDAIVTVSSTGIATPSIEAHVMHEMGFRDDVLRIPVFGLGCAGGVTGLAIASRIAQANPAQNVLLVVIELCTLHFRPDEMSKSNIVATALFGDGAAAVVVNSKGKGPAIEHAGQHTWNNTIDIMGWRVDDEGLGAIFARSIPDLVMSDLRPAAEGFLRIHDLAVSDIDHFSFHPGGTKVVQALETVFAMPEGKLDDERAVLAGYGNMSAPTVMFVLERALKNPGTGRRFVGALGPGFTASFATLVE